MPTLPNTSEKTTENQLKKVNKKKVLKSIEK